MSEDAKPIGHTVSVQEWPVPSELLPLTAQIVSAHLSSTQQPTDAIPGIIQKVHAELKRLQSPEPMRAEPAKQEPAVSPKKSVFPDYIVCLEDGKKLKMLKRHLKAAYGMTPDEYRTKWGLGTAYPMVAPSYAERRSALAKGIGLGRKPDGRAAA